MWVEARLADLHRQLLVMIDRGLGTRVLLVQLIDLVLDEADGLETAVLFPRTDEAPGTVSGARPGLGAAAAQWGHGGNQCGIESRQHEYLRNLIENHRIIQ